MNKYKLFIALLLFPLMLLAAGNGGSACKFRIYLKDKGATSFSVNNPQEYLSEKAIERRIRQHIPVDETDLPLSPQYADRIEALGCTVVAKSKWMTTITVHCDDSATVHNIKALDFVKDAVLVWKGNNPATKSSKSSKAGKRRTELSGYYGNAYPQIAIHNGDSLHHAGFKGQGMEIAVLDGGFKGFDANDLLENVRARIKGRKNFVYIADSCYEVPHGSNVLSCMATDLPGLYIGTAPEAGYWLLQTENPETEYPVEEDYWVAAAEYADSVGVDVINSSLGYSAFNDPLLNYTYAQIDGKTTYITQGADMAAEKGILVVVSAGNEGSKPWHYVTPPADAENVLTVGAIQKDSLIAGFSSRGPTSDLRIKPDVVAVGSQSALVSWDGDITTGSGTSYASPIMCGLATCLWQAFPSLTNKQLRDVLRQSANRSLSPDNNYGYGIPDMIKAMELAKTETANISRSSVVNADIKIFSDKAGGLRITKNTENNGKLSIRIVSIDGKTLVSDTFCGKEKQYQLNPVKNSLYIVYIRSKDYAVAQKVF
ncbi:MAG: S8 family serine peptidase [Prevotella sp.]|jgi:subtilisin family serine protease|nr:S8 family serine peptidase [Prevotella sp.]